MSGEVTVHEAPQLEEEVTCIAALRPMLVVADLSELRYIASLGLGSLLSLQHCIGRAGGRVRLAGVQPAVGEVIRRANLQDVFRLQPSVEAAIQDD